MLSQQKRPRLSVSVTSSNSFGLSLVQRPNRASHHGQTRRLSLTNTLSWLGRSGPAGRSQPKLDLSGQPAVKLTQGGRLGTGAVVVRTPEDALRPTNEHLPPEPVSKDMPKKFEQDKQAVRYIHEDHVESERDNDEDSALSSPRSSPAYTPSASPHAPLFKSKNISTFPIGHHPNISLTEPAPRLIPRPIHKPPPLSVVSALPIPLTPPASDPSTLPSPTQLTFAPIRVSPIPPPRVDQSDIIVSLETATVTYRARFETLTSRPSKLATYLTMQLSQSQKKGHEEEDGSEPSSPFMAILEKHLKTSNASSDNDNVSPTFHIFLDRPSAPYVHILTHLRTPPAGVQTLPRAVQLRPRPHPILPDLPQLLRASGSDRERIEALIELREEALHLALDDLALLCTEELLLMSPPVPQSANLARDDGSDFTSVHGESDFVSIRSSYATATSRATSRAPSVIVPLSMHIQDHSPRANRRSSSSFQYAQAEPIRDSIAIPRSIATSPLDRVLEEEGTVALQVSDTLPQWSVARDERTEDTFPLSAQPSGGLVGSQSESNRVRFQPVEKESAPSVSQQQTRTLGDHGRIDLDAVSSVVNRPPSTESNSRYNAAKRKAETSKSNGPPPPLELYSQHLEADYMSNVTAPVPEAPNMDEVLSRAERQSFSTDMLMPKERESMDSIEPMLHRVRAELRAAFEQEEEIRITSSYLSASPVSPRARADLRSRLASVEWEGVTARARMSGIEERTGAQRFGNGKETKEIHAHNARAPSQGQPQPSRHMLGSAPPGWI